ncbi:gluconokinase [Azospirillum soli]|uniref:gluconokinase n=1 Tax=Azospirillum soli TaxID=1304799 RepID=UPI001AE7D67F|nr:gluconokinase [Azospirillum soli]MBP2312658.1 gluconokinase [Azospirillum soli]
MNAVLHIILMGVCGSGKTSVGEALAQRLGCRFADADSFHPAENVEKMRAGIPLNDEDRGPWLTAIRAALDGWSAAGESSIIACSALKQAYRDVLSSDGDVIFVYLKGSKELIAERLKARSGHYMNPNLLQSQIEALEEPADAIVIDVSPPLEVIVDTLLAQLKARSAEGAALAG